MAFVIEGQVPVADIECLLEERPHAIGLAASGMSGGSPGMEMGANHEAHEVVLVRPDGFREVWSTYPGSNNPNPKSFCRRLICLLLRSKLDENLSQSSFSAASEDGGTEELIRL